VSELSDDERRRIEAETIAKVAAERWRVINARLSALEGEGWAAGPGEAELVQVTDGPEQGRVFWQVGSRQLSVAEYVIETTVVDGRATRRRVIGPEGVVADDPIVHPDLN
jgi:hypothetical protein